VKFALVVLGPSLVAGVAAGVEKEGSRLRGVWERWQPRTDGCLLGRPPRRSVPFRCARLAADVRRPRAAAAGQIMGKYF